jgi:transforming growth factor-beta-induced protein
MFPTRYRNTLLVAVCCYSTIHTTTSTIIASTGSHRQLQSNTTLTLLEAICSNSTPNLTMLCTGVENSQGIVQLVNGDGPYTVFGPEDEYLSKIDPSLANVLIDSSYSAHLLDLLKFHIVEGTAINSSALPATPTDTNVTITMSNGENATIGYRENLGPVFLMGNATVPVYVTIQTTDIEASNGILHTIGGALLPAWANRTLSESIPLLQDQFSILTELIPIAFPSGLPPVGGLTIFAPLDSAFEKIDPAVLADLKNDSVALLGLLANHVSGGVVPASALSDGGTVTMYNSKNLTVTIQGTDIMIGEAKVEQVNILANNGIVHAIDTVLMLESTNTTPTMPTTPSTPTITMPMVATPTASAPAAAPVAKPAPAPTSASYSIMMMITTSSGWIIGSTIMMISHILMA